jgi:hypothetical protein
MISWQDNIQLFNRNSGNQKKTYFEPLACLPPVGLAILLLLACWLIDRVFGGIAAAAAAVISGGGGG